LEKKTVKGESCLCYVMLKPSKSYRALPAIWDHTLLPATRHRWMCPILQPQPDQTQFS